MRAVVLGIAIVGCGGSKPPPAKPAEPPEPRVTRVPVDEPEEDDDVEVVSSRGHMEIKDVEAGLAPHKEALSTCYMSRVGRRRWLGGHATLHWDIDKSGEVTSVKLAESDLGSWAVEKCLLEVAREATFNKPVGGSADFMVPLEFAAKGRAITWDEDQGLRAVGGQIAKLDECGKAKGTNGVKLGHPQDVTITLYVGPQGKAVSVGFSSPKTAIDDEWAECAEKVALAWRLPDPRGTIAKLAVRYRP